MTFGTLIVKPLHGKILSSLDPTGKQDLYLKVKLGGLCKESAVFEKAGRNPLFDYAFEFKRTYEDNIHVEIWSAKEEGNDAIVGVCDINFQDIITKHNQFTGWVPINLKKKVVGELYVECDFMPEKMDMKTAPEFQQANFGAITKEVAK